jgi:hypothetical protein
MNEDAAVLCCQKFINPFCRLGMPERFSLKNATARTLLSAIWQWLWSADAVACLRGVIVLFCASLFTIFRVFPGTTPLQLTVICFVFDFKMVSVIEVVSCDGVERFTMDRKSIDLMMPLVFACFFLSISQFIFHFLYMIIAFD